MANPPDDPGSPPAGDEHASPAPEWNPEIAESLFGLLYRAELGNSGLHRELREMEREHGDSVYSELIYLLSHLRFEAAEARQYWGEIVAHRDSMEKRLGKPLDLRVALVSYFVEVNRKLKNPKIIELKLFEQTQASVYRDELTGLSNFRFFRECLTREIQRGERDNSPLSLVMVDIDNFKAYNDQNGHEAGNQALVSIARLLADSLRKIDVTARYGGEEFALILPSTSKTGAGQVAERARERIEKHAFPGEETQPAGRLTVSMGVATCPADAREAGGLVRCADGALYVAKSHGRNQIQLYGENRRSYRRISAALNGKFCLLAAEYHPLSTVDVSEGGILFLVDRKLALGTLIDISLMLPDSGREIAASGRVVRVEEKAPGKFTAALRIIDMPTRDQILLSGYIRGAETDSETSARS